MKTEKFVISAILIFALTNHAYGMGGHHHSSSYGGGSRTTASSGGSTTTDNRGGNVVTYQHSGEGDGGTFQGAFNDPGYNGGGNVVTYQISYSPDDPVGATAPEPATMFLLGSGLIGLAAYGRKKFFKK